MKYTLIAISFGGVAIAQSGICDVQYNGCLRNGNDAASCSSLSSQCASIIATSTSSPSPTIGSYPDYGTCYGQLSGCLRAGADQAGCSAQYTSCVATATPTPSPSNPITTPAPAPVPNPTPAPAPAPAPAPQTCEAQQNACRTAPGANQSFCSAQYASCVASRTQTPTAAPNPTAPPYTRPTYTGAAVANNVAEWGVGALAAFAAIIVA